MKRFLTARLAAFLVVAAFTPVLRAEAEAAYRTAPGSVQVTISAECPEAHVSCALSRKDVQVYQNGFRRPIVGWTPTRGDKAGLDLAILVDDTVDPKIAPQFAELSDFIRSLLPSTRVAVVYAHDGITGVAQDFTSDHVRAARALRLPIGTAGAASSIYDSLVDLIQRWPQTGNRREVLLITDGIDLNRSYAETAPGVDLALDRAVDKSIRDGITVYSLFVSGSGQPQRNFLFVSDAQADLTWLASETGGEAYSDGFQTPATMTPFLNGLKKSLEHQYLLTFQLEPGHYGTFQRFLVVPLVRRVELVAPEKVYVSRSRQQGHKPAKRGVEKDSGYSQ